VQVGGGAAHLELDLHARVGCLVFAKQLAHDVRALLAAHEHAQVGPILRKR